MTFIHAHRVRSYEVDHQGIVFNGRYLEITDAAMTEYFEQQGDSYPDMVATGFDPAVVAIEMSFSSPARLGDDLHIAVSPTRIGTSSFDLRFNVSRDAIAVATILTTYVTVTNGAASSTPVPEPFRSRIATAIQEQ